MSWDIYDIPSSLDSEEFINFCVEVRKAITQKMGIGDIRRAMGEKFDERKIFNALDSLVATGDLKECWGARYKWEPSTPKPKKTYPRNTLSIGRPSDKTQPYSTALYGNNARGF